MTAGGRFGQFEEKFIKPIFKRSNSTKSQKFDYEMEASEPRSVEDEKAKSAID